MKITEAKAGMKVAAFGLNFADLMFAGAVDGDSGTVIAGIGEPLTAHPKLKEEAIGETSEYVYISLDKNGQLLVVDETQSLELLEGGN